MFWIPLMMAAANGARKAAAAKSEGKNPWTEALKGAGTGAAVGYGGELAFGGGAGGAGAAHTGATAASGAAANAASGAGAVGGATGGAATDTATALGSGATIAGNGSGMATGASTAGSGSLGADAAQTANSSLGGTGAATTAGVGGQATNGMGAEAMSGSGAPTGGVGGQSYWSDMLKAPGTKGTFSNDVLRQGVTGSVMEGVKGAATPTTKTTSPSQGIPFEAPPQLFWGGQQMGFPNQQGFSQ